MTVRSVSTMVTQGDKSLAYNGQSAVIVYQVDCDSRTEAATADDGTTAVAQVNTSYADPATGTTDTSLKCHGPSVSPDGAQFYTVTCQFSRPEDGGAHLVIPDEPTLAPQTESWQFATESIQIDRDVNDAPIINSAGDVPSEIPTKRVPSLVLTITKNVLDFDIATFAGVVGKVNNNTFKNGAAGRWFCESITTTNQKIDLTGTYFACVFRFIYREDGWQLSLLNRGVNQNIGLFKTPIIEGDDPGAPATDDAGTALTTEARRDAAAQGKGVSTERLLDANGSLSATATFEQFDIYEEADFSALAL